MRLLLDENITPKAKILFESLGNDVESLHSLGLLGLDDQTVFSEAQRRQRVLITHNGKDFIIQIPPKRSGVNHHGLLWLKYEMNRKNAEIMCQEINGFFKIICSLKNSIWVLKKVKKSFKFEQRYPYKNVIEV